MRKFGIDYGYTPEQVMNLTIGQASLLLGADEVDPDDLKVCSREEYAAIIKLMKAEET